MIQVLSDIIIPRKLINKYIFSRGENLIYSHKRKNSELEKLSEHLQEVADKCSYLASFFNSEDWGKLIGELHDLGKNTKAFQDRLLREGPKVDHSTIGAQVVFERLKYIPAFCIAGHHSGLMNGGSFESL